MRSSGDKSMEFGVATLVRGRIFFFLWPMQNEGLVCCFVHMFERLQRSNIESFKVYCVVRVSDR